MPPKLSIGRSQYPAPGGAGGHRRRSRNGHAELFDLTHNTEPRLGAFHGGLCVVCRDQRFTRIDLRLQS
jgi:hypothetical protein